MWDGAYLLFIIPFSFYLSCWVLVSFRPGSQGNPSLYLPREPSKREDKMRKFLGAREESVRILLMINLRSRRS